MTSETDSAIDLAALKRVPESRADIEKRNDARGRSAGPPLARITFSSPETLGQC